MHFCFEANREEWNPIGSHLNFTELTTYLIIGTHAKYDKIKAEEVA
jgi:hypothetical protein